AAPGRGAGCPAATTAAKFPRTSADHSALPVWRSLAPAAGREDGCRWVVCHRPAPGCSDASLSQEPVARNWFLGKALRHHLIGVLAEAGGRENAFELAAHQGLARRVVAAP